MDTGQHDLLASACCKCAYLLQNILRIAASYPASCKRDDTVRTKLITAVLYFDIGTRPVFRAVDNQVLILFCMININFFCHHTGWFFCSFSGSFLFKIPNH